MRLILLIFVFSATYAIAEGFFTNHRRRSKIFRNNEDSGKALYLTKYIEEGDIETVSHSSRIIVHSYLENSL